MEENIISSPNIFTPELMDVDAEGNPDERIEDENIYERAGSSNDFRNDSVRNNSGENNSISDPTKATNEEVNDINTEGVDEEENTSDNDVNGTNTEGIIEQTNTSNEIDVNTPINTTTEIDGIISEDMEPITNDGTKSNNDTNQNKSKVKKKQVDNDKLIQLPLSRVKAIMKMDPDCHIISSDSAFLMTKATELFLKVLSSETFRYTQLTKRKTIAKKDLDNAVDNVSALQFLDGTLEQVCRELS